MLMTHRRSFAANVPSSYAASEATSLISVARCNRADRRTVARKNHAYSEDTREESKIRLSRAGLCEA